MFFFVIKYQFINHSIDDEMLFQKKYISPTFSTWVGLGLSSKADLEKKSEIFGVYQLLTKARKYIFF